MTKQSKKYLAHKQIAFSWKESSNSSDDIKVTVRDLERCTYEALGCLCTSAV